ncbi:polyketide synthase dehydratase domain-containing protein, partial [Streptomyces sp. NPDC093991]
LTELTLQTPLTLPEDGAVQVQVVVGAADATGQRDVAVYARPEGAEQDRPWARHAEGLLGSAPAEAPATESAAWPPAGAESVDVAEFYPAAAEAGYGYGPAFRGLRSVWRRGEEVFAEVALPEPQQAEAARFGLHPALLDSALHAIGFGSWGDANTLRLPFAWTGVSLHAAGADRLRVRITAAGDDALTVEAADAAGRPVATVSSLVLRTVTAEQLAAADAPENDALFALSWTPVPAPQARPDTGSWAVLGAEGEELSGAARYADLAALAAAVEAGGRTPEVVVHVLASRAEGGVGLAGAAERATADVLALAQAWLAEPWAADSRLVVVTRGAVAAGTGEDVVDLVTAPAWGLIRSAQTESPGRFLLVDLEPVTDETQGAMSLVAAVGAALAADETQIVVRGGGALAPRLVRPGATDALVPPAGAAAWRLDTTAGGTLDGLALLPAPEKSAALAPGEVRVAVRAAGVNFRDVLIGLGMVPSQTIMGSEGAGVVVEVGEGVTRFAPGDRVTGLMGGALGPLAVTDHRVLAHVPEGWSFEQAASV